MVSGPPLQSKDNQDSNKLDADPNKEISRIVPPAAPSSIAQAKPQTVPPGPKKQLAAQSEKPDPTATDDETARKGKPIECGTNAKVSFRDVGRVRLGQVVRVLTSDETMRSVRNMQFARDLFLNPSYTHYTRILIVHLDDGRNSVGTLPPALSVQIGDRVEFQNAHPDASAPCHFIPALVSRVL